MPRQPRYGFRFSIWDALIVFVAMGVALGLYSTSNELWWVVPMTVGHFFLFCNVFMVWRKWELLWAGSFVINVLIHALFGNLSWWPTCLWQLPITLFVIALQIRSPWYHGIWAARLNPRLEEYLNQRL